MGLYVLEAGSFSGWRRALTADGTGFGKYNSVTSSTSCWHRQYYVVICHPLGVSPFTGQFARLFFITAFVYDEIALRRGSGHQHTALPVIFDIGPACDIRDLPLGVWD